MSVTMASSRGSVENMNPPVQCGLQAEYVCRVSLPWLGPGGPAASLASYHDSNYSAGRDPGRRDRTGYRRRGTQGDPGSAAGRCAHRRDPL